jgi:ferredoxin-thioredoxin reductase catalytic subunit
MSERPEKGLPHRIAEDCVTAAKEAHGTALEEVTSKAKRHAERGGFDLQPDEAQLRYVLNGLAENLVKFGKAYCPCRPVTGDAEKDRANICPCRSHREEIDRFGACECGLFTRRREKSCNKETEHGVHD